MYPGSSQPTYVPPTYGSKRDRRLSDCGICLKYLLIVGNIFVWMLSCAVIGVGVWILVDKNFMQYVYGNVLMTVAAYLIVVAGGVTFLITGLGCIGAIAQSRCMLLTYCIILCGVALFLIVGVILAIVYRTEIRQEIQYSVMRETLQKDYGVGRSKYNQLVTSAWDKAQTDLRCCAVEDNSWNVYQGSEWYKKQTGEEHYTKPLVPESCCKRDQYGELINKEKCQTWQRGPPGIQSGVANEALHYRGCYEAGKEFISDFTAALIGMGVGIVVFIISGIVMSFMLFRLVD